MQYAHIKGQANVKRRRDMIHTINSLGEREVVGVHGATRKIIGKNTGHERERETIHTNNFPCA